MRYRTYSDIAKRRLPAFEDAGVDVAREVMQGEKIDDDVRWKRDEELDLLGAGARGTVRKASSSAGLPETTRA